jgi:hypothetical protein
VRILHHILTTRTELRDFIKSFMLYLSVYMQVSLRRSFYLRRSLGGYMVGTTTGFLVEIMEALALQSRHQILWKYPQYHMSTYSTDHRVISTSHPPVGGLGGYYRGNVPCVPWATSYGPKFWMRLVPSSGKWLANHTPHTRKWPHHSRLKQGAPTSKELISGMIHTITSPPYD